MAVDEALNQERTGRLAHACVPRQGLGRRGAAACLPCLDWDARNEQTCRTQKWNASAH